MTAAPQRTVARPVANLGNTCYMNAVLQALAHAPELCLAIDCEPHQATCPVAAETAKRRSDSPSSSPETEPRKGTRKSRRRSPQSSDVAVKENNYFCVLCEIELHIHRVHDPCKLDKPVAPSTFVNGFIEHVAPWFKLGVQEDSHEFLRLLIDAMQQSCKRARAAKNEQDRKQENGAPTNEQQEKIKQEANQEIGQSSSSNEDTEYPFSLFRGTVESNVICESCKASSATLDPIEDIGLEVTLPSPTAAPPERLGTSRNSSPVPTAPPLADVQTAFARFARAEELDSGYKCEKCGKVGRATKQSRLASIPPILTLQLKRFRYGDAGRIATASTGRTNRRSEVNQLSDTWSGGGGNVGGKSGSAKIEGHIKFDMIFDLKPYLTEKLQAQHSNMFCRLFAVIVHAGKNSHSGHYIAYVRDISKNEWWKMDDGRVTPSTVHAVLQAEAYMLFYRIVQHPVAVRLEELHRLQTKLPEEVVETDPIVAAPVEEVPVDETLIKPAVVVNRKKRPATDFADGMEWVRAKTNLPPAVLGLFRKVQELVAEDVQLSPEYFKLISAEAAKEDAAIGKYPAFPFPEDDLVEGVEKYRHKICEILYKVYQHYEGERFWIAKSSKPESEKPVAVVEPEDVDLL